MKSTTKRDFLEVNQEAIDKYNAEFAEAYAQVVKNLEASAKDPDHPSNDRIKAYFEDRKKRLATMNEKLVREAFADATGNVNHEFSQDVIERCKPLIEEIQQRLIAGDATFQDIDNELMAEWNKLKTK